VAAATPTPAPEAQAPTVSFAADVLPIFEARCGACHGPAALAGLTLTTYGGIMQGGGNGPAVIPGDPDGSLLLQKQKTTHTDAARTLTTEELTSIVQWIAAGAPDN